MAWVAHRVPDAWRLARSGPSRSHLSQGFALSGDLPLVSLGPVRVLDARLSTRGIPRLSRSRARPLLALWVQGSRGTASERITTISLDSTCSQLFCNGTGLWALGGPRRVNGVSRRNPP